MAVTSVWAISKLPKTVITYLCPATTPCCVIVIEVWVLDVVVIVPSVVSAVITGEDVATGSGEPPIEKLPEYVKVTLAPGASRYPPATTSKAKGKPLTPEAGTRDAFCSHTNTSDRMAAGISPPDFDVVALSCTS